MHLSLKSAWEAHERSASPSSDNNSSQAKGKRRRLMERISRFASSPSLHGGGGSRAPSPHILVKHSVSCVSLAPTTHSNASSDIDVFVECQTGLGLEWKNLPDEVKMQILGWLEPKDLVRCSAVSKKWHELCFDGHLWKTLDASDFYNRIPVDQLAQLIVNSGAFIRHLNLRGCIQLQRDWRLDIIANACRNLRSASLEGCQFGHPIVHCILLRNPLLVHLNLCGLQSVNNATLRTLSRSCTHIETLNVSFCTNADGRGLRRVVDSCRNLRELRACELQINDPGLFISLNRINALEKLCLGHCSGMIDEFIRLLIEGIEPEIDIFTNRAITPPRKLTHLDLSKCSDLTDASLRALAGNIPSIQKLELAYIPTLTDAAFIALLPTTPNMTHLDVEDCTDLTDTTLQTLSRSPCAAKLQHLQISYCENMTDTGLASVLRKCDNLQNLELDNTRASDATIIEASLLVSRRPPISPPLRLVVFDCASITWTGIREALTRNSSRRSNGAAGLLLLKCFYAYQRTVDEHTRLLLRGDPDTARMLERKWSKYMMAQGEAEARGGGTAMTAFTGRRRDSWIWGDGAGGGARRRRACVVM